jgi:DNA-directed RNA polymerase subunit RPC12/RpoP
MYLDYEYTCNKCKTDYIGESDIDDLPESKTITCEECGHKMDVQIDIDVIVNVSSAS